MSFDWFEAPSGGVWTRRCRRSRIDAARVLLTADVKLRLSRRSLCDAHFVCRQFQSRKFDSKLRQSPLIGRIVCRVLQNRCPKMCKIICRAEISLALRSSFNRHHFALTLRSPAANFERETRRIFAAQKCLKSADAENLLNKLFCCIERMPICVRNRSSTEGSGCAAFCRSFCRRHWRRQPTRCGESRGIGATLAVNSICD